MSSQRSGLVVGVVDAHPLVHLRVPGSDETICVRRATFDWPTKTYRAAACLGCLEAAVTRGFHFALDSDGIPVTLKRLLHLLTESSARKNGDGEAQGEAENSTRGPTS